MTDPVRPPSAMESRLQWVAYVMLAVTAVALAWVLFSKSHQSRAQALGLAEIWPLPAFTLTDQAGQPFHSTRLAGHVVVADFIYTRCGASCPTLTAQFKWLQGQFKARPGLQLMSVTVDPLHDTPRVLSRYARQFGADLQNWVFLSGSPQQVDDLMQKGFKLQVMHVQVDEAGDQLVDIPHSSTVALIDRRGVIRAYYEGIDEANWPKLEQAVGALLEER